jgi:hypothetical protein
VGDVLDGTTVVVPDSINIMRGRNAANTDNIVNNARINVNSNALRKAADRSHWDILFTAADPVHRYSGRLNQSTAAITIRSQTMNSWIVERDTFFTLVDAFDQPIHEYVKISSVILSHGSGVRTAFGHEIHRADLNAHVSAGRQLGGAGNANTHATAPPRVQFWNRSNLHDVALITDGRLAENYRGFEGTPRGYSHVAFDRDGGTFTVRDLRNNRDEQSTLRITFNLSAHPNFQGDVFVKVSGGGIEEGHAANRPNINTDTLQIATFWRPLIITAETTDVQIGYLDFAVADITIEEQLLPTAAATRVLQPGDQIVIEVGSHGRAIDRTRNRMSFVPGAVATVNNFVVSDVLVEAGVVADNQAMVGTPSVVGGILRFNIVRTGARTTPASITLTNLFLDIDRTVPWGPYDLIVNLEKQNHNRNFTTNTIPITASQAWMFDRFPYSGMTIIDPNCPDDFTSQPYVFLRTEGAHVPGIQQVILNMNDQFRAAVIDGHGLRHEILDDPIIHENGRLYVPVRWVSQVLGLNPDTQIRWDGVLNQVTIFAGRR